MEHSKENNDKYLEENYDYENVIIIKSHIKRWFKNKGYHCKSKSYQAINDKFIQSLERIIKRTKLAKRKTVSPEHI